MMLEPGERQSNVEREEGYIDFMNSSNSLVFVVEDGNSLVGYLYIERGWSNQIKHTGFLIIGLLQGYRGQGFAKITCSAFIEYCLDHDLIPAWDADSGNEPSNKLSLKLGFDKSQDINILWWHENVEIIKSYLIKYNY